MQAVVLAAGEGKRLLPLTKKIPKPLVVVAGRPLIEYILDALPDSINEIILVIGYRGDLIKNYIGDVWRNKKVRYAFQKKPNGTFDALKKVEPFIHGKFLVLAADVFYKKEDIKKLFSYSLSILIRREYIADGPTAICKVENGLLSTLEEQSMKKGEAFVNCSAYCLDKRIFNVPIVYGSNGEEWLSSMVGKLAIHYPVNVVIATAYWTVTVTEDIKNYRRYKKIWV